MDAPRELVPSASLTPAYNGIKIIFYDCAEGGLPVLTIMDTVTVTNVIIANTTTGGLDEIRGLIITA